MKKGDVIPIVLEQEQIDKCVIAVKNLLIINKIKPEEMVIILLETIGQICEEYGIDVHQYPSINEESSSLN